MGDSEQVVKTLPIHILRFYWLHLEVILWLVFVEKSFLLFLVVGSFGWKNHQGPLKRLSKGLNGSVLIVSCPYINVLCHDIRHRFFTYWFPQYKYFLCTSEARDAYLVWSNSEEQLKIKRQQFKWLVIPALKRNNNHQAQFSGFNTDTTNEM